MQTQWRTRLQQWFFAPVDAASVAVFRVGFGIIMFIEGVGHLGFYPLHENYVEPAFFFKYYGFEWVPAVREGIYLVYGAVAIAGILVALGLFYRLATLVLLVGMATIFLQDQAQHLNHIYLVILYCGLMCVLPAHRYWSLDAKRNPELATNVLPAWCRLLLIAQVEIVLIYAGLVKLNSDWLQLEPLATWLTSRTDLPLMGGLFDQPWAVAFAAYGVIALHLVGAPLLLLRKARYWVLAVYAIFHLQNHFVFNIGIFPWVTWFASLICLDPDWPRQFWSRWKGRPIPKFSPSHRSFAFKPYVIGVFAVWFGYQTLFPLRHHLYPGDVAWNEAGHRFSWRMKLRSKQGWARFTVVNPDTGQRWRVDPAEHLTPRQARKFICRPDMLLQFAHSLRDRWKAEQGVEQPQVFARVMCRLNFRELAPFVDPKVDLAAQPRSSGHFPWIMPMDLPLNPRHLPWQIAESVDSSDPSG